jgi:hypothetical protein
LQTKKEIFKALGLNWTLKDGMLHHTVFPWLKYIEKYNKENWPLELTKNSIGEGKTDAKNAQKLKWLSIVLSIRKSILEYWEKLYFPKFH